mmetsp:Transcript_5594/g.15165  ORF Transcript_5594/g.15165 Transcript_5594/m.15165 type:complete len:419 (-) Transcript_5594:971-2227(-)|eukprot:CAMPEP_0198112122 /NCGR_PEP_ID=MMETSP1442-20131203/4022_1 /TAXON_ID= /ORGANISM="Craspedostauros australis, Strain CCMP3328" /LENGTH=418 /DNA_ID=CAMNT_0043768795 /DNA_START=169 /DNA_END=1425 /DNA_ORIENTATION=+
MTSFLLTGDIGGTNSRMGLYTIGDNMPLAIKYFRNQEFLPHKEDGIFEKHIIAPFLKQCWEERASTLPSIDQVEIIACLAVAGPVRNNKASLSNLHDIEIDGTAIANQKFCPDDPCLASIRVCTIINDFVAQGYGCLTLKPSEVLELTPGSYAMMDPMGPKVCVGAGTGLGECYLTPSKAGEAGCPTTVHTCFPSEGGHVEYAPRNDLEVKMWKYLKAKFKSTNRISVERVVSGRGLANCYEFLASEFKDKIDPAVHKEFLEAEDMQGKVVAVNARPGTLCLQAMEIMMGAYGAEVGCASIKFIPTGGMYVTGGLTPKNIDFIQGADSPFMKAYKDKGRVAPLLESVPLFAVLVEDLGVRGAHKAAMMEYERLHKNEADSDVSESDAPKARASNHWTQMLAVATLSVLAGMAISKARK